MNVIRAPILALLNLSIVKSRVNESKILPSRDARAAAILVFSNIIENVKLVGINTAIPY